jgi:predicted RNA methylase
MRNCFIFASNTIEATRLYFRSKQNSEPSAMQIMVLFHLTLNPWQQSCLDHAARTGTRAMAVSVLHAQASAMQQQIVFI